MKRFYIIKLAVALIILAGIIIAAVPNLKEKKSSPKSEGALYIEKSSAMSVEEVEEAVRNSTGLETVIAKNDIDTPEVTPDGGNDPAATPDVTSLVTPSEAPEATPTENVTPEPEASATPSEAPEATPTEIVTPEPEASATPEPTATEAPKESTPTPTSLPISADICIESYNPYAFDAAEADEAAKGIDAGSVSAWNVLAGAVYVGDSVTTGFDVYGFVNSQYVIANVGAFLKPHLRDNIQNIIAKNPSVLILHYGVNGMTAGAAELDGFIANYKDYINQLKAGLPNTKIIVTGIFPAPESSLSRSPALVSVNKYNQYMLAMCKELGVGFANSAEMAINHQSEFAKDGIHISGKMYNYWVADIVKKMRLY